ncbi:hypothetical protein ElyMa_003742700, partial [Elysia marginata]
MNSSVYRQRRPNEQHTRPEPTATQIPRLQLHHGPVPTATETLGLGSASSATSEPIDDPTPEMTTDEDGHLLQRRTNTHIDEELLSDTAGVSAFPKSSELDLLAEEGELDEEALLGLDDSGAAFSNDPMQPIINRQRSKNAGPTHQDDGSLADQAFVFEVADTGDLEDELTGNELGNQVLGTYSNEGVDPYSHDIYEENPSGDNSAETDQNVYSSN